MENASILAESLYLKTSRRGKWRLCILQSKRLNNWMFSTAYHCCRLSSAALGWRVGQRRERRKKIEAEIQASKRKAAVSSWAALVRKNKRAAPEWNDHVERVSPTKHNWGLSEISQKPCVNISEHALTFLDPFSEHGRLQITLFSHTIACFNHGPTKCTQFPTTRQNEPCIDTMDR